MKKCAVINDLSGFGKCSLTAAIPIISVMGSEVHPLPTAVLSNQTAYNSFKMHSLTDDMPGFIDEWQKLNAHFDGIMTGFVTDIKQLEIIESFIDTFKTENTVLLVDPVMADNGKLYDGYTPEMCIRINMLCHKADIITPNLAELAVLADKPYSTRLDDLKAYARQLQREGIEKIVVTGYKDGNKISNLVFDGDRLDIATSDLHGGYYSGTGDITASVIIGGVLRGMSLIDAATLATKFIEASIISTSTADGNDGIDFEKHLGELL